MPENPVWLIDASIYVFRPWFVRQPIVFDREGNPVNAVLGFLRFIYNLLQTEQPQRIAFAFDSKYPPAKPVALKCEPLEAD